VAVAAAVVHVDTGAGVIIAPVPAKRIVIAVIAVIRPTPTVIRGAPAVIAIIAAVAKAVAEISIGAATEREGPCRYEGDEGKTHFTPAGSKRRTV
jgi:hypothetical protein